MAALHLATSALRALMRAADSTLWAAARLVRALAIVAGALTACVAVVVMAAAWEVSRTLPATHYELIDGRARGSVTVVDRNGAVLGLRGERFQRLTMEEAGPNLLDAILSTEDRRFFWHLGVDPIGLARALLVNWRAGRTEQGGSSITQQVAKLAFLTNERRLERKLREAPIALALEFRFSKKEILEIYLNRAYLGGGAFGFRAAAKFYFEKEPSALSKAESALLAGLLRAPSKWSPLADFSAAQERARVVLDAMVDAETLSPADYATALGELDAIRPPRIRETAPHFVDWADQQVPDRFWEQASDLVLVTTLDRAAQASAEQAIYEVFQSELVSARDQDAEASMVVLSQDGAVRAMVGGRNYALSQFNRAASSRRQLGSAFKPFVYAAALGAGVSPRGYVADSPVRIGKWAPKNYAGRYRGEIPLTTALAKSSNVAAVRLARRAGFGTVADTARRFGFSGDIPRFPSISLGIVETSPLEVASAYATLRRSGRLTPAWGVSEIRSRGGDVLWRRKAPPARQAVPAAHAEYLTTMMRAVVEHGTGRRAQLDGRAVAGKTGTTQDYRDAWFAGFTGTHVAVAWMGKDDFTQTARVTGGRVPAEIWRRAMAPIHETEPVVALAERELPFTERSFSRRIVRRPASGRQELEDARAQLERFRAEQLRRRQPNYGRQQTTRRPTGWWRRRFSRD